jgi:uncharacterized GH25 family protein
VNILIASTLRALAVGGVVAGGAAVAQAHFVWVAVENVDGKPTANVWFSETAEPGEADLIDRIASAELTAIASDGRQSGQKPARQIEDELFGALVAELDEAPAALVATCDYGVIERGGVEFRLWYFARYAELGAAHGWAHPLPVDLRAEVVGGKLVCTALVEGKPTAGLELTAQSPKLADTQAKTDEHGQVHFESAEPGLWSLRVKKVDEQAGELDDKKFTEVRSYATLALRIPDDAS